MTTWIALFRGINVGGNNMLPMAQLKRDLESLELKNVRTYIQSGNVVFESSAGTSTTLTRKIRQMIKQNYQFNPQLILLTDDQLQSAIAANPFPEAVAIPKSLHFCFLAEPATAPNLTAIVAAKSPTEQFKLTDGVFYLFAPEGVGRSKLAATMEKQLGVVVTARNYRTVEKLAQMLVNC